MAEEIELGRKSRRKRKPIRRFGEGISENCVFDLSLSYSDETQQAAVPELLGNGEAKHAPEEQSPVLKGGHWETEPSRTISELDGATPWIAAAQFFIHVSLLVVPGGLRKSPSLNSISEISPGRYQRDCLTTCSSLPDLHDLVLHRRYK